MPTGLKGVDNRAGVRWYRIPYETRKAYEAFSIYRDMGKGRTKTAVAKKLNKNLRGIMKWAADNDWDNRVDAFDADEDFQVMTRLQEMRIQGRMEDLERVRVVKEKVSERLEKIDVNKLTWSELIKALEMGIKMEDLLAGKPAPAEARGNELRRRIQDTESVVEARKNPDLANDAAVQFARNRNGG